MNCAAYYRCPALHISKPISDSDVIDESDVKLGRRKRRNDGTTAVLCRHPPKESRIERIHGLYISPVYDKYLYVGTEVNKSI